MRKRVRTLAGLARQARAIQREGQGVWRFEVFDCVDLPEFLLDVLLMGRPQRGLAKVVFDTASGLASGSVECDCLLCGTSFGKTVVPRDIVALSALTDDPKNALAFCICNGCHDEDHSVLRDRIAGYLRDNLISDLRVLPPLTDRPEAMQ